jgi:hypothetical protein
MRGIRGIRLGTAALVVAFVAGCGGGPAPATPASGSGEPAGSGASTASGEPAASTAQGPAPSGITLIDVTQVDDAGAAAKQELQLATEIRGSIGLPALLGPNGASAFTDLDAIETRTVQPWLAEAAAAIGSGTFPTAGAGSLTGQLAAAVDGGPPSIGPVSNVIDLSLFAETGFTTSSLMGMFTDLVERAGESIDGRLTRNEPHDEEGNGLRQHVDVGISYTVHTGAGNVTVDIIMTATDNITDVGSGRFVALYTSRSTGHFDVDACPDQDGVAKGTYTFETTHELNDVSGSTAAQASGGRTVDAPFSLVNGPDAHLVRIEANLDLGANGRGPGSAGGPGPTAPFDWTARQSVPIVMPANGGVSTSPGAGAMTVTGSGGEAARGSMFVSSAMAQLFIGRVGKEAETFWRSGKCIDLTPSDDSREVDAAETIDLTINAKHKFTGEEIEKPIVATFTGKASLDPNGSPVDEPATYHFKAGDDEDDKGTIDLKQTSNRGIGLRQVVYTVKSKRLTAEVKSDFTFTAGLVRYDTTIHLPQIPLEPARDGTYKGTGTVQWSSTITINVPECRPKTYTGSFGTEVTAKQDPANPDAVLVTWSFQPGRISTETLACKGGGFPFPGTTLLAGWAIIGAQPRSVPIDGSTDVTTPLMTGSQKATIFIKKAPRR